MNCWAWANVLQHQSARALYRMIRASRPNRAELLAPQSALPSLKLHRLGGAVKFQKVRQSAIPEAARATIQAAKLIASVSLRLAI